MGVAITIRLDDDVRRELESQAQDRDIELATLLRELATDAARAARRARIRGASEAVTARVAASPDARAFYESWGTPNADC